MKTILNSMSRRVRLFVVVAFGAVTLIVGVLVVQAEPVPRTFAYQGVLTDDAGNPITGAHVVTIGVFADASATTALCAETESVTVTNGLFRMTVGDGGCTVDPTWFTLTAPAYLEVQVDTVTLSPRTPLLPVASAYQAEHAETAGRMIVRSGLQSISVGGIYCGATAAMTGSLGGYAGAKALCETVCGDPAAHMCAGEEIVRSAQLLGGFSGVAMFWFSAGVDAAVVGSPYGANDCLGWTSAAASSVGYVFRDRPYVSGCGVSYGVACCL
jgi:hypothetical protein